jgi:hypothetical protein
MAKRIAVAGLTVLSGLIGFQSFAQTNLNGSVGAITTAVPFLRISPDARSGAMGDVGIALSPDANAQYWNVAKLAMSPKDAGISVTYTPWLKDLVPDVFLGYISAYKKINASSTISGSLRYFNLGNIDYTTFDAQPAGSGKPREFSFDLGYSLKLSPNLSTGATLRYVSSNIAAGAPDNSTVYSPGKAFAADIGIFYTKTHDITEDRSGTFNAGAVLSNVGSKISYSQQEKDFLPINLGIGVAYTYKVDAYNKVTVSLDLNKALVPAPIYYKTITGEDSTAGYIPNDGIVSGMLGSFTKAPPGYGTTVSLGGEYWYQDQFAVRAGYFYENKNNGDRQYFTCGLGVKYQIFGLNFSYLIPSGSGVARNPLSNTLRFSLLFDFDKLAFSKKASDEG